MEESIYTDDPVRVYLREMGAVPLLTREGEVDLARRMERGKLRMQKAISRSALVQGVVVDLAEQLKKGSVEIEAWPTWATWRKALRPISRCAPKPPGSSPTLVVAQEAPAAGGEGGSHPGRQQESPQTAVRPVEPGEGGDFPGDSPHPFRVNKWKDFSREIERAVEEINHLDSEIKKLEARSNPIQQVRLRELKREIRKREVAAGATLPELRPQSDGDPPWRGRSRARQEGSGGS